MEGGKSERWEQQYTVRDSKPESPSSHPGSVAQPLPDIGQLLNLSAL